jgi:hypothetical protein
MTQTAISTRNNGQTVLSPRYLHGESGSDARGRYLELSHYWLRHDSFVVVHEGAHMWLATNPQNEPSFSQGLIHPVPGASNEDMADDLAQGPVSTPNRLERTLVPSIRTLCAALCLGFTASPSSTQSEAIGSRMQHFVSVLRSYERDSLSQFFPAHGEWRLSRAVYQHGRITRVDHWSYSGVGVPLSMRGTPGYSALVLRRSGQAVGPLISQAELRLGEWRCVSMNRFVPPGAADDSQAFVTWRREGDRWVIDEIGDELFDATLPDWWHSAEANQPDNRR